MKHKISTIGLIFFLAILTSCKADKEEKSEELGSKKESTVVEREAEVQKVEVESVSPINHELAEKGEEAFKNKGCIACHTIGKGKLTGPDLAGVTQRRKLEWIQNQILHPEVMLEKDPIARELLATYLIRMPNQGVTPEEAKAIIMYLRMNDSEMKEKPDEEREQ